MTVGTALFDRGNIGALAVANRLVRSATWEGLADSTGAVTPALVAFNEAVARGGVGLVISGHAYVSPEGRATRGQMGVHDDAMLPGLRALADAVHAGGAPLAVQLAHGGGYANGKLNDLTPLAPSGFENAQCGQSRDATPADLARIVADFAAAARRARLAGCDAVQLHAAHGYLLSEFLSPVFNRRTDEYGGALANRARLLLQVIAAVRAAVGPAFPLLVKLNSEDFADGGFGVPDMITVAGWLAKAGVDALELSGGLPRESRFPPVRGGLLPPEQETYYLAAAEAYRAAGGRMTVILVGGIRTRAVAERILAAGTADFIGLCRPLIREPGLPRRWAAGDCAPSGCVSCNLCRRPALLGNGPVCAAGPGYKEACKPRREGPAGGAESAGRKAPFGRQA